MKRIALLVWSGAGKSTLASEPSASTFLRNRNGRRSTRHSSGHLLVA
jgi:hypothetical protein